MSDYGDGRIYQRGRKFWIDYSHRGERYREPGGRTEQDAKRKLKARLKEIAGDRFIGPIEERVTVDELLNDLEKHLETREAASLKTVRSHLKHVREFFVLARAADVTTADIERFIAEQQTADYSNETINRRTGALRQAFNLASRRKPAKLTRAPHVPMLPSGEARQGFVEPATFEAIASKLDELLADVARFAYRSAWRKSHVLSLRWSQVSRSEGEVRAPRQAANKRVPGLPLVGDLAAVIERRWKARTFRVDQHSKISEFVFHIDGEPIGEFRKSWATACRDAGAPGTLFHDLRRSAVRNLIRGGTSQAVAMRISGHRTTATFVRYDITSLEDKRAALEAAQALTEASAKKPTKTSRHRPK